MANTEVEFLDWDIDRNKTPYSHLVTCRKEITSRCHRGILSRWISARAMDYIPNTAHIAIED